MPRISLVARLKAFQKNKEALGTKSMHGEPETRQRSLPPSGDVFVDVETKKPRVGLKSGRHEGALRYRRFVEAHRLEREGAL